MSLIIPWGVFTRYVLGTGSQWPEPIAIMLMVVFTFLGAAAAYRANCAHRRRNADRSRARALRSAPCAASSTC